MRISTLFGAGTGAVFLGACLAVGAFGHEHAKGTEAPQQSKTITGELIDMNCYMAHDGKGEKHRKCADTCISGGSPMGLLASDGKVYLLVGDHVEQDAYDSLKEKASEQVTVTGPVYQKGGVQALQVKSAQVKPAQASK